MTRLAILRTLLPLLLVALGTPASAQPAAATGTIRALFVGIDRYRYSTTNLPDAEFKDLRGAAGDSRRFKEALRKAYAIDFDKGVEGDCRSSNAVSTSLVDDCATREAILSALDDLIARSGNGDTLVFFYAGHGSRLVDDSEFDQASGGFDTILPTDARNPDDPGRGDILDRELRGIIDRATSRGVNVVTVFDSCHAATAVRGQKKGKKKKKLPDLGEARFASPLLVAKLDRPALTALSASGVGYRVHLGAALDKQQAREAPKTRGGSDRQGLFTSALIEAIDANPRGAFADFMASASEAVNGYTQGRQTPQGEGALNATFGGPDRPIPLFDVRVSGDNRPELTIGALSGMTQGSRFALFRTFGDALGEKAEPLAIAVAGSPGLSRTPLLLEGKRSGLPPRLVARETQHAWQGKPVRIHLDANLAKDDRIASPFVADEMISRTGALSNADEYVLVAGVSDTFAIAGRGVSLAIGGADAGFNDRLAAAVRRIATVESLLALANASPGSMTCVSENVLEDLACPSVTSDPVRPVAAGVPLTLLAANRLSGDQARYLYVLQIDERLAVTTVIPRNRGIDDPVEPERPQRIAITLRDPGLYRFLTIASVDPLNTSALELYGTGPIDADPNGPNGWTASLTEVMVGNGG